MTDNERFNQIWDKYFTKLPSQGEYSFALKYVSEGREALERLVTVEYELEELQKENRRLEREILILERRNNDMSWQISPERMGQ